jgi:hypothetical protein
MDPLSQESIIARQRERILARIEKANQLIDEYENILLSSGDPPERLRAKEGIAKTKFLRGEYESELTALASNQGHSIRMVPQKATTPTQEKKDPDAEKEDSRDTSEHNKKSSYYVQELDKKLEELQRGIDDLKRGQGIIYQLLTETRNQELQTIVALIRQGDIQQDEMKEMLVMVQQALSTLQDNQVNLSQEVKEAIANASSALNSETSLQGKLELTLPIIPLLLDYKVELAVTDSIDLNKFWENTQVWWKSLTKKAYKNIWSVETLIEYGTCAQSYNTKEKIDPLQAGRKSLHQYHEEFDKRNDYLSKFEAKINQSMSNLNILIKAQEEFSALENLADKFLQELMCLSQKPEYPTHDLERVNELAGSIANQAQAAAGLVATNGTATPPINQIKRNLPMLRRLVKQLLSWLEQMAAI